MSGRPRSLREASAVREVLNTAGPWSDWLDMLMDEFYTAYPDKAAMQAMLDDAPDLHPDDPAWNAFYAAAGEHLARRWGLSVPAWTEEPERMGTGLAPVYVPDLVAIRPLLALEAPDAFRRRNLFVGREPLQRARWPRDVPKAPRLPDDVIRQALGEL